MNWKITALGIAAILLLLIAFSTTNIVFGYLAEHIKVFIPKAVLDDVEMYGAPYVDTEGMTPSIYQEIRSMECPRGQVITRTMIAPQYGVKVTALLTMAEATMYNVKIYAWSLTSSEGTLSGVTMTAEAFPEGVKQTIDYAEMYNLETFVWQVTAGTIKYTGLTIRIIVEYL